MLILGLFLLQNQCNRKSIMNVEGGKNSVVLFFLSLQKLKEISLILSKEDQNRSKSLRFLMTPNITVRMVSATCPLYCK